MNVHSFFAYLSIVDLSQHVGMDKKEAILNSLLKAVNIEGFYHLNMKKIAEGAGIAPGTIYLYFKGKEELINDLYKLIQNEFNKAVSLGYKEEQSMQICFMDMLTNAVTYYLNNPYKFSFIEQYTYAPFIFKETQEENFALLLPMYKLINRGKNEKIVKDISNPILISIIHGSINTILKMHLAQKTNLKDPDMLNEFKNACWNAIVYEKHSI